MAAILVVEDERIVANDIAESLRKMGYDVVGTAASAEECLRQAAEHHPDLVLMDVRIEGDLDGIETAKRLRTRYGMPIIYLTAYADEETVARACETEPHGYILKPFRTGELRSMIEVALSKHQVESLRKRTALAERLTSLGTLAAGVAHEINNPLTYILGNAALAYRELESLTNVIQALNDGQAEKLGERVSALAESVHEIEDGAERIRRIVTDLQVFARPETGAASGDARAALDWALRVTDKQVRERARLETHFAPMPLVRGSGARLGQVFVNLLLNAAQAIDDGRPGDNVISVTTGTDQSGRAVVTVRDTGHGMPEDIQKRIFEPFFTTKPVGSGTGLGLSICHGIVQSLGGEIKVESRLHHGTTFRVYLAAAGPSEAPESEAPQSAGTRGRILVIDDEPQVAKTMERILRGHDVRTTPSALAALDIIAKDRTFHLVFCDLAMPDLTGMDFHERLSKLAPDLAERVVFMSGGVFTERAAEFLNSVPNLRMPKPFTPAELRGFVTTFLRDHPQH
ncbi:MAG TPA: response regulator [Polyangiaceae bacterium]